MVAMLISGLGLVAGVVVGYFLVRWIILLRIRLNPCSKLPGFPPVAPFFGLLETDDKNYQCSLLRKLAYTQKKFGKLYVDYATFGKPVLFIQDAELARQIFVKNAKNYKRGHHLISTVFRVVCGSTTILAADGEMHKRLRKLAAPAFKQSLLVKFLESFQLCAQKLSNTWQRRCTANNNNWTTINVRDDMAVLTLDCIGLTAFGYNFGALDNPECDMVRAWRVLVHQQASPSMLLLGWSPIANFLVNKLSPLVAPLGGLAESLYHVRLLSTLVEEILEQRRSAYAKSSAEAAEAAADEHRCENLIDLIIKGETIGLVNCKEELEDMVKSFVLAGHQTTAVGLSWFLLCMAQNHEWQDRCRAEIIEHGFDATWECLFKRLKCLNACLNEAMRLYPPVPAVNKSSIDDDIMDGHFVPGGTEILVSILGIHRDPAFWPDADKFNPKRFLNNDDADRFERNLSFMPFGEGSHVCIGNQFAKAQILMVAAILLKNYEIDVYDKNIVYYDKSFITSVPTPTLQLNIRAL